MKRLFIALTLLSLSACTFGFDPGASAPPGSTGGGGTNSGSGQMATVTRVIDGDTIDVSINGQTYRVRYIGMNTPESNEVCFNEATQANALFVSGQTVRLVKDVSETDVYGRLLRYVYVGDLFVNAALVEQGFAEVVSYPPDTAEFDYFKSLEIEAHDANRGCHPTGIFDDGTYTR